MTEAEWLACEDPGRMLIVLRGRASDRKLRLWAVACCRTSLDASLPDKTFRELAAKVEVAECYADGNATAKQLRQWWPSRYVAFNPEPVDVTYPETPGDWAGSYIACEIKPTKSQKLTFLRCLFGNPFRPVSADPGWLTSTVLEVARGIYAERAFDRLPILADALMDAGCDNAEVLDHCRGPGPHVRGCWVVDLILGKT